MDAYELIENGDWPRLKRMIEDGYEEDCSDCDYDDEPYLFFILYSKDPGASDAALFWINHGYPIRGTGGKKRMSAAHAAILGGKIAVLRRLLELGINVNVGDYDGDSLLYYAVRQGDAECVRFLLEHGADPDGFSAHWGDEEPERRDVKETPLSIAPTAEIAALLLDGGADMNICAYEDEFLGIDSYKYKAEETMHPLSRAAFDGREETVRLLLSRGADPNWNGGQPLRILALSDRPSLAILQALLEAGADIDGKRGEEPLRLAARMGHGELCEALLQAGAKPIPECIRLAARARKPDCVRAFAERGEDVAQALRMAARRNRRETVAYLLRKSPQDMGHALHGAIEGCHFDLARDLLDQGADPNARDELGRTAFVQLHTQNWVRSTWRHILNHPRLYPYKAHDLPPTQDELDDPDWMACGIAPRCWNDAREDFEKSVVTVAELLIRKGARIQAVDGAFRSALWHAARNRLLLSIPWLASVGLNASQRDGEGISCFEAGCLSNEAEIMRAMLSLGCDINARDAAGDTVLHKLARRRDDKTRHYYGSMISCLIEEGADPDLKNGEGMSVRDMAKDDKDLGRDLEWGEKWAKEKK